MPDEPRMSADSAGKAFAELDAMRNVVKALEGFDREATTRILRWVAEHKNAAIPFAPATSGYDARRHQPGAEADPTTARHTALPDLIAEANPRSGPERAMVVAYWFQVVQDAKDFDALALNKELKQMGHNLANVTATLSSLINQRPQLVIQTQKIGSRKRYKLTTEGIKRVESMLKRIELNGSSDSAT